MRGLGSLACAASALALSACGGGGGGSGSSSADSGIVRITPTPSPSPTPTAAPVTRAEAVRLAKQATFGPTTEVVDRITRAGVNGWIDQQFATIGSTYQDIADRTSVRLDYCTTNPTIPQCTRNYFSREPVAMRFYADAMSAPDQLRQRVAFALSQLLVASEVEVASTSGIAAYNQILLDGAFGNYRDVLQRVTLSSFMGNYLDMADSNRTAPSENYAREMLQLFSMGPDALNMDGTPQRDASGGTVPNYTTDDIKAVSRALTGWTYARVGGAAITDGNARDYAKPMITVPARYDTTAKTFFGTTVPAGASQEDSVRITVDAAFNHPSTAPYVSKFLIQHLVTSNPSPGYVGRVAAAFANNGAGVRGDMKAVIRAILTDTEARTTGNDSKSPAAKVKEPILMMTALMRVVGMSTSGYPFVTQDANLGQGVFRSPSVFNFYPPDYPLPGNTNIKSPPSKLVTTTNVLRVHNLIYNWTIAGDQNRGEFVNDPGLINWTSSRTDWTAWENLRDIDAAIAEIDLLMLGTRMTDQQKAALKAAATAITNTDPALQARRRAQTMIYIVATSPHFLVDR